MRRRTLLSGAVASGAITLAGSAFLLASRSAFASTGAKDAFLATTEPEILLNLFGHAGAAPSDAVRIEAPLLAMYGRGVPITVQCDIPWVELIAIVTRNNLHPLNSLVRLEGADGYYSTRIRLQRSSAVVAYAKTPDALYFATAHIKLSRGGYGTQVE